MDSEPQPTPPTRTSEVVSSPPTIFLVEILSANVPGQRSAGGAWDAVASEQTNVFCDVAVAGAVLSGNGEFSGPIGGICSALFRRPAPDAPPSDPDVYVELDLGPARPPLRTETVPDSSAPSWSFSFYLSSAHAPASMIVNVVDEDPQGREDRIGSIVLRRDALTTAAETGEILSIDSNGVSVLLRATNIAGTALAEPRSVEFDVSARDDSTPALSDREQVIPVGARLHIEATGFVSLGDPSRYPATDATGSSDVASRASGIRQFQDTNFGALLMLLGAAPTARQWIATGRCVDVVATQSGIPQFTTNDLSRTHNRGALRVRMTIEPPALTVDPLAPSVQPCELVGDATLAEGVVTHVEVVAPSRKRDGSTWDGDRSAPDLYVVVSRAGSSVTSDTVQNASSARFVVAPFLASEGPLTVAVWDRDLFDHDGIGTVVLDLAHGQTEAEIGEGGVVRVVVAR